MAKIYVHNVRPRRLGRPVKRLLALAVCLVVILAGVKLFFSLSNNTEAQPVSQAKTKVISATTETTTSPYFQFQDNGKWVLDQNDSNANRFVYTKFRGNQPQQLLYVYVNQLPTPLSLASDYVLPVHIVNGNSFDATSVSGPCVKTYGSQPKHVQEVTIGLATMLCDPSDAQYSVELAQVGGNYQLDLHRSNGQAIQLVIIYKDVTGNRQPDSLLNIANSFKTL